MHDLAVRRLSLRELRGRFNGTLVRYRSVKWRLMVYTSFDVTSMGEGCDEVAMFVGGLLFGGGSRTELRCPLESGFRVAATLSEN